MRYTAEMATSKPGLNLPEARWVGGPKKPLLELNASLMAGSMAGQRKGKVFKLGSVKRDKASKYFKQAQPQSLQSAVM